MAGSVPIEQVVPLAAGQRVNRGCRIDCELEVALAVTRCALTVLHTQMEYVTMPRGDVVEFRAI